MAIKKPKTELKRARARGRKIVEEAKIKALGIIADAYGEEIQKIAGEIAIEFKNEALVEIARFKKELEDKIVTIEGAAEQVIAEEYDEIKAEIERYKASKLTQIQTCSRSQSTTVSSTISGSVE